MDLLLVFLSIIIYNEVLPTLSIFFELIRTWLASKIAIIQQNTSYIQEDIQNIQERLQPQQSNAVGFEIPSYEDDEEEYYDEDE